MGDTHTPTGRSDRPHAHSCREKGEAKIGLVGLLPVAGKPRQERRAMAALTGYIKQIVHEDSVGSRVRSGDVSYICSETLLWLLSTQTRTRPLFFSKFDGVDVDSQFPR